MSIRSKKSAIGIRIRRAMRGYSEIPVMVLLVARAILDNIQAPGDVWTIMEAAREQADDHAAIAAAREAIRGGQPVTEASFNVTADAWVCYVAIEMAGQSFRAVCVELLDPYDYSDPGAILEVTTFPSATHLPVMSTKQWGLKLSDL